MGRVVTLPSARLPRVGSAARAARLFQSNTCEMTFQVRRRRNRANAYANANPVACRKNARWITGQQTPLLSLSHTFMDKEERPDLATARFDAGAEVHAAGAMKASVEAAATSARASDRSILTCSNKQQFESIYTCAGTHKRSVRTDLKLPSTHSTASHPPSAAQ